MASKSHATANDMGDGAVVRLYDMLGHTVQLSQRLYNGPKGFRSCYSTAAALGDVAPSPPLRNWQIQI